MQVRDDLDVEEEEDEEDLLFFHVCGWLLAVPITDQDLHGLHIRHSLALFCQLLPPQLSLFAFISGGCVRSTLTCVRG